MSNTFSQLGLPDALVDALAKGGKVQQRITVYAPHDGIVATLNVREGMYMKLATEIMSLADLSSVRAAAASVAERWGQLDLLINNAGVGVDGILSTMPDADVHRRGSPPRYPPPGSSHRPGPTRTAWWSAARREFSTRMQSGACASPWPSTPW